MKPLSCMRFQEQVWVARGAILNAVRSRILGQRVVPYRCRAKTLAPASPVLTEHPPSVNLREDHLVAPIDR